MQISHNFSEHKSFLLNSSLNLFFPAQPIVAHGLHSQAKLSFEKSVKSSACTTGIIALFSKLAQACGGEKANSIWATNIPLMIKNENMTKTKWKKTPVHFAFHFSYTWSQTLTQKLASYITVGWYHSFCDCKLWPASALTSPVCVSVHVFILEVMFDFGLYFGWNIKAVNDSVLGSVSRWHVYSLNMRTTSGRHIMSELQHV